MTLDFPLGKNYEGDLWINMLLSSTESLVADAHYGEINLNLAKAQSLRWLALDGFKNIRNISLPTATFPLLEFLSLENLEKLEEIWDDAPLPSNSFHSLKQLGKSPHRSNVQLFSNLSTINVSFCRSLSNLFSSATTAKGCFVQLESITIEYCGKMEHVVVLVQNEEDEGKNVMIFPKLKRLFLDDLPNLTSICRGIQSIEFPLLAEMEISCCDKMRCLVSSSWEDNENKSEEHYGDDHSLHLFCQPKVSFGNLKKLRLIWNDEEFIKNVWCDKVPVAFFTGLVELEIGIYGKIRRLFSSSSKIPQNLTNLQKLEIYECNEMVKVIEDEEVSVSVSSSLSSSNDHPAKQHTHLFPSLQELVLSELPKLESFCEWRYALELPSLKTLIINSCHEMKSFNTAAGSLIITPALRSVKIDRRFLESVDDLNAVLHQKFEKAKKKRKN